MLDRIAKNETYLNMARDRAAKLGAAIRDASAASTAASAALLSPASESAAAAK
jgi:type II secretory pathway component PulM